MVGAPPAIAAGRHRRNRQAPGSSGRHGDAARKPRSGAWRHRRLGGRHAPRSAPVPARSAGPTSLWTGATAGSATSRGCTATLPCTPRRPLPSARSAPAPTPVVSTSLRSSSSCTRSWLPGTRRPDGVYRALTARCSSHARRPPLRRQHRHLGLDPTRAQCFEQFARHREAQFAFVRPAEACRPPWLPFRAGAIFPLHGVMKA